MKTNFLLIFALLFLHFSSTKSEEIALTITNQSDLNINKTIGTEGIFSFETSASGLEQIFDPLEIESETIFDAYLIEEGKNYSLNCSLFDPKNKNVVVKCFLLENIEESSSYQFTFSGGKIVKDNITINIIGDQNYLFNIELKTYNIPFIYSDPQNIDLDEETQESYELRFKVNSYQGEKLALVAKTEGEPHSFIDFDEIKLENNELKCNISRKKIEEVTTNQKVLYLVYLNGESGIINFEFVDDINIKYTKDKQNFEVELLNSLTTRTEHNSLLAIETNIINISPLTSDRFDFPFAPEKNIKCFFKKYDSEINLSLILLCESLEADIYIKSSEINLNLDNIHYKYNFKIISKRYDAIWSRNNGKKIFLNYPVTLDFKKRNNYTIEYFMTGTENFESIRFVKNSPILECQNENYLKKCIIDISHFIRNETGYYYTLYTNYAGKPIISYDSRPIKIIVPYITIMIEEKYNKDELIIGEKGSLYFMTSYNDTDNKFNSSDIEERTKFNTTIYDENNNKYKADCRLWKPENKNLVIICKLNEDLIRGEHSITFNDTSLNYEDYIINIYPETSVKVKANNFNVSFFYSDEQTIQIDNNTEIYEFKFKYDSYNKSDLFFIEDSKNNFATNFAILDQCENNEEKKELTFQISIEKIESFLGESNSQFSLGVMNDEIGVIKFGIVYTIHINYEIEQKENVYVKVENLLETNTTQRGTTFAFNTNVTEIQNLRSTMIPFSTTKNDIRCYFKKDAFHSLLLICMTTEEKNIVLNTIVGNTYDKNHYKYNFVVATFYNDETIYIKYTGVRFFLAYPEQLDLYSQESVTIRYLIRSYAYSENKTAEITLNPDSSRLNCKNLTGMIKCVVPRSHFQAKESGYYYTRYLNQNGNFVINYDIDKFNVTLPPNPNIIKIELEEKYNSFYMVVGLNGVIYFETSYNDTKNIFDSSDIENLTSFKTNIIDENENKYNVICRLWKPLNDNLRLFCDLQEPLVEEESRININDTQFAYKNYTIKIISKINLRNVRQTNKEILFLYSGRQTIYIE